MSCCLDPWVPCYVIRDLLATMLLLVPLVSAADVGADTFVLVAARSESNSGVPPAFGESAFSMQKTTWPGGTPIQLVILPTNDATQNRFARSILHLAPYQAETRWLRYVYSGQALKPIVVHSWTEMRETLSRLPGAVGYFPADIPLPSNLQVLP